MKGRTTSVMQFTQACNVCDAIRRGSDIFQSKEMSLPCPTAHCSSTNLVYGLTCCTCKKLVYVGETGRSILERFKEYDADIRLQRNTAEARHFTTTNHSSNNLGLVILELIKDTSKHYRKLREVHWIQRLQTEVPNGLNTKTNMNILWAKAY
jgi:hypothetical protein